MLGRVVGVEITLLAVSDFGITVFVFLHVVVFKPLIKIPAYTKLLINRLQESI